MTLKGAKVLVAGGTGFIGTNLILRLLKEGCKVRATRNSSKPALKHGALEYIKADLTIMKDCHKAAAGMDHVFMCAANTSGAAVMATTPLAHVTPNVVMNTQMLEAAYLAKVKKYLFISSTAAYPPSADRPVKEDEMFSGDPHDVYYPVGWMKRYSEILCKIYAEKIKTPMPAVVVRPSNIYGPYDKFDFKKSHMMAALIRRVIERHDPLEIWGAGNDIKDLIYIDDFIEGMMLAFEKTQKYLAVNIASGRAYSIKEVLAAILDVDGYKNAQVRFDPSKPQMIPMRLVDTALARQSIGFSAKFSLNEGISRTIAWYREHYAGFAKTKQA
ncbi:NAD-dependent epimerase/dehydratase family protein [Elusimicrobiota bacterium]